LCEWSEIKGIYIAAFLPNLRMRSTEDLRIKLPIVLRGDGACIYLSADLDTLMVCEIDVFDKKVGVERKVISPGRRRA